MSVFSRRAFELSKSRSSTNGIQPGAIVTLRVAGEEPSSQEAARAERGTRAKSLRAEAQTGSSCHVAIASSLWKRRAYPVEISAEQNFGEGQGRASLQVSHFTRAQG